MRTGGGTERPGNHCEDEDGGIGLDPGVLLWGQRGQKDTEKVNSTGLRSMVEEDCREKWKLTPGF
jgi:hypothetical protein